MRQLAAEYLKRQQEDRHEVIDADKYQEELQKVKAHIALHQVYGVDLNATAVELAEISLWLDTMVAGLQAPWFGLHLRRGNSLIGARRAVYVPTLLAKKAWLTTAPKDVPLGDEIGAGIHHFLLPSHGWGAVIDTAEAKTYAPDKREVLRLWRNGIRGNPSAPIKKRLAALARRVETLWGFTLRRLTIAESEIRRDIDVWGVDFDEPAKTAVTREQIEHVLHDDNGAYRRLRRVMDAWCALWSWPLTTYFEPPDWDQWVGGLEAILGVPPKAGKFEKYGQTSLAGDLNWEALDLAEDTDRKFAQALSIDQALYRFPWLTVSEGVAKSQGFFHWELDFAPVFIRGGFDLQVGNPPWVRPDWDEAGVLAEFDPWWQLADKPPTPVKQEKLVEALGCSEVREALMCERVDQSGINAHLASTVDRTILAGLQPDLHRCFVERAWKLRAGSGIVALIHPDGHFTEARASALRRATYHQLRRHWQFRNELKLFEIGNDIEYGVHIYGAYRARVSFIQSVSLFHPDTVNRSFNHDGSGPQPAVKDAADAWDVRPHYDRLVTVDDRTLASWASVIDEPGTPPSEARMLYPVNRASADVLNKIAAASRLSDNNFRWTPGWHENADFKREFFELRSAVPLTWDAVILQGPHLTVGTPLAQQPNPTMKSPKDNTATNFEKIGADFIPRTNYQPNKPPSEYTAGYPKWDGQSSAAYFRIVWREWSKSTKVRTLQTALLPPGPCHVHALHTMTILHDHTALVRLCGISHSLIADFMIKMIGSSHVKASTWQLLPYVRQGSLDSELLLRTLRLNCVIAPYAPLWEELYVKTWQQDSWVPHVGVDYVDCAPLGRVGPKWEWATPLRRAADRRQALVEIDAIVAIMLGITTEELLTIYRTQFPVLQKYERDALYDANGRQLPGKLATEYRKKGSAKAEDLTVEGVTYVEPFVGVDRERDMELAHKHFSDIAGS